MAKKKAKKKVTKAKAKKRKVAARKPAQIRQQTFRKMSSPEDGGNVN